MINKTESFICQASPYTHGQFIGQQYTEESPQLMKNADQYSPAHRKI
jgi:hypothetical protein